MKRPKSTRFELLPRQGDTSLVMTLNSHLQRQERAVMARSVLIDEVTEAYEKLHATVSLEILYRAVDRVPLRRARGIRDHGGQLRRFWPVGTCGKRAAARCWASSSASGPPKPWC